jgi:filamentous hemagglutinin
MRRRMPAAWVVSISLSTMIVLPTLAGAVITDADLCPFTGAECVVSKRIAISDPQGVDVRPLVLRIKGGGALVAASIPAPIPLTVTAAGIIIESGGIIDGNVAGGQGNDLTLNADAVTVQGTIQASATRVNNTGGDGGSITVTSTGACQIFGKLLARGSRSVSIGGSGGTIEFDCATLDLDPGAQVDVSGSGPGGLGGSVAFDATVGALNIFQGAVIRAFGAALDGGSISLSTDSSDITDSCDIGAKLLADARTSGGLGGAGGGIDIECGGDVVIEDGATFNIRGSEGGGSLDVFAGGNLTIGHAAVRANGVLSSGGSIDMTAGNTVTIAGKLETRSGGDEENDGSISVTNGGDLVLARGGILDVSAGRKSAQTGQITLAGGISDGSSEPLLSIEKGARLKVNGYTAGFGAYDVDISGGACVLGGSIESQGVSDNGVAVGFTCDSVNLAAGSQIQATSRAGSGIAGTAGGSVTIDTTAVESGGTPGDCDFAGKILLQASSGTFIDPGTSARLVSPAHGGTVDTTCGGALSVYTTGALDVSGSGSQSVGGAVSFSANLPMHIAGSIKARASGSLSAGGQIAAAAPDIFVDDSPGALDVGAQNGGTIEMSGTDGVPGAGVVNVNKALNASGSALGGAVVLSGCDVTVGASGWLRADGSKSGGVNQVRAQNQLTITGTLTATHGENDLFVAPSMLPSLLGSTIKPTYSLDASLLPCP